MILIFLFFEEYFCNDICRKKLVSGADCEKEIIGLGNFTTKFPWSYTARTFLISNYSEFFNVENYRKFL
jgi:hypothetical protein